MRSREWIGVDFDDTLVEAIAFEGIVDARYGAPIMPMVNRVRGWREDGKQVRIMTARVCDLAGPEAAERQRKAIEEFCLDMFQEVLPVTNEKDFYMIELWDDRAVQVEPGVGEPVTYWSSRV